MITVLCPMLCGATDRIGKVRYAWDCIRNTRDQTRYLLGRRVTLGQLRAASQVLVFISGHDLECDRPDRDSMVKFSYCWASPAGWDF